MPYADKTSPAAQESLRAARRRHYRANAEAYKLRARERQTRMRNITREARNVPCADCGGSFPWYVMDFDHRPGEIKLGEVTVLAKDAVAEARIRAEMAKCDVVCANCHRIRTVSRILADGAIEAVEVWDAL